MSPVCTVRADTVLDTPQNVCAILPSERELQPSPNRPIRYGPKGHGAEPAGTRSRIDPPALDAHQGCGADVTLPRDVRPREDVRTPSQPNKWRRPTPRGGMPLAFPMPLPSLPFGFAHGSSVAAGTNPPWPWEGVSIGLWSGQPVHSEPVQGPLVGLETPSWRPSLPPRIGQRCSVQGTGKLR